MDAAQETPGPRSIDLGWTRSSWFWAILVVAIATRIALALVNREANDDHIKVVQLLLAQSDRILTRVDCWQCYHPKLYHNAVALLAGDMDAANKEALILTGQLLSALAGIATLLPLTLILSWIPAPASIRLTIFAVVALNARFTAINAQAVNDSFVIAIASFAFCALGIYALKPKPILLYAAFAFALLSIFAKGSGIFVCVALALSVACWTMSASPARSASASPNTGPGTARRAHAIALALFLVAFGGALFFGNPYRQHREGGGSPFLMNGEPHSIVKIIGPARSPEPSLLGTFFTFRYINLISDPTIDVDGVRSPHSFWTHLYGRAMSVRFDKWPKSWITKDSWPTWLGRIQVTLGIVPFMLLLFGTDLSLRKSVLRMRGKASGLADLALSQLLALSVLLGMSATIVWRGPSPIAMKFIYLLPALIPMSCMLAFALMQLSKQAPRRVLAAVMAVLWIHSALSLADILLLVRDLA